MTAAPLLQYEHRLARAPHPHFPNIYQQGENFIFRDSCGKDVVVVRSHLKCCLEYSLQIRTLVSADRLSHKPMGYDDVARIFNSEPSNPYKLSIISNDGRWVSTDHPEPPVSLFLVEDAQLDQRPFTDRHLQEFGEVVVGRDPRGERGTKDERAKRDRTSGRSLTPMERAARIARGRSGPKKKA